MGKLMTTGHFECEIGGVYHICYFSPPEINDIIHRKGKENIPLNGEIFPYIVHYLTTGDLIYPAHEGDAHISSLLEEMGRLDLVKKLFHNQLTSTKSLHSEDQHRTSGKDVAENESSQTTLRIKTKEDKWVSKTITRLWRLPKSDQRKQHQVYRPPPQHYKGTTLVVVRSSLQGNTQTRVHGPSAALKALMPNSPTVTTIPTHHHLNSHIAPSAATAHSVVMSLEENGYVVTVRSSRVEGGTGALITQWLLYRGSNKKLVPTSRRTGSLGKALGSSKKDTYSTSTARKKVSKSESSNNARKPFPFGSDTFKLKTPTDETGKLNRDVNSYVNLDYGKPLKDNYSSLHARKLSNSLHSLFTPSSGSLSSKSVFSSLSLSPNTLDQEEFSYGTKKSSSDNSSNRFSTNDSSSKVEQVKSLPADSFSANDSRFKTALVKSLSTAKNASNLADNNNVNNTKNLTFSHKSFSSASIVPKTANKIKTSPSLLNICPKASVKKMFNIIF